MIQKIKKYYQRNCIKKVLQTSNRPVKCVSLSSSKYIGVLYQIKEEQSYIILSNYIDKLMAEGKTIRIIGYHDNKFVPYYCIPKLKYDFFCQKEQNWFGKPTAPFIDEFANEPFDILIDLSMESLFPLQYILAKSTAPFKVGRQKEDFTDLYDLMINLDDNHTVSDLIHYINEYTSKLNGE